MENKIVTMANAKFGTVRKIVEGDSVLYCARDVATALGYATPQKAVYDHCKGVLKRNTPTKSGNQQMSFIPEADVYRLICHSKLPSAMEFEKWVFEDVVPKAVNKNLNPEPEQFTLETSEYHYFPKTLNGEPVITVADFAYFTKMNSWTPYKALKKVCIQGEDWLVLSSEEMSRFKRENPSISRNLSYIYVIKASGVKKLLKYFKLSVEIPMIEEKKAKPVIKPALANVNECIVALGVLGVVRENLKRAENKDGEEAINAAIQYTSWEMSKRMIGDRGGI